MDERFPEIRQPKRAAEVLFALGVTLPLFAGGNTLFALEPRDGIYLFDAVSIFAASQILRATEPEPTRLPGAVRFADACLLLLGVSWIGALLFRPAAPRAFPEAQGILCAALLFATLSSRTITREVAGRFITGLTLGTLATAAFGQYQYWIAFPRAMPLARAAGIPAFGLVNANFYSANCYGAFLAAAILLTAAPAAAKRHLLAWFAVGVLAFTIVLSGSRASITLAAIGAVAVVAFSGWRPKVGTGTAGAVVWILLPAAAGAAAGSLDLSELWRVATVGRISIWKGSLAIVRDHWLLGVGLGRFGAAFADFRVNDYHTLYPHSFLLEIAAELGVIAGIAIVGFLVAAFSQPLSGLIAAVRGRDDSRLDSVTSAMVVACIVLLAHGLVDIDWHAPANPVLLFVLLGLLQRAPAFDRDLRDA